MLTLVGVTDQSGPGALATEVPGSSERVTMLAGGGDTLTLYAVIIGWEEKAPALVWRGGAGLTEEAGRSRLWAGGRTRCVDSTSPRT